MLGLVCCEAFMRLSFWLLTVALDRYSLLLRNARGYPSVSNLVPRIAIVWRR